MTINWSEQYQDFYLLIKYMHLLTLLICSCTRECLNKRLDALF